MTEQTRKTVEMPLQVRDAHVRTNSFDEEKRTAELVWSAGTEVLRYSWAGKYKESLSLDPKHVRLDRLNSGAPLLDTHNMYELGSIVGVVEEGTATVDGKEGRCVVRFANNERGNEVMALVADGIIRNVSVGYRVHTYEKTEHDDDVDEWRAVDWEPHEVSLVPVGADPKAGVRSEAEKFPCEIRALPDQTAQSKENTMSETVETGKKPDENKERETETVEAPETKEPETRSEKPTNKPEKPQTAKFRDITAAFTAARLIDAKVKVDGKEVNFRDHIVGRAEDEGLTIDQVRAEIFDYMAENEVTETQHTRIIADERDKTRDIVENSLLHRFDPNKYPLEDGARQFRGLSLMELGSELAKRGGAKLDGMDKMQRAGFVLGLDVRSGGLHSTSDFPYILANVANKTLRDGYDSAPRTFLPIARRVTLPDFKQVQRTQLGEAPKLNVVVENGEYTYGTIGEGKEVYQLATYGRIVGISRQAIINDDLDAFTRIPTMMGTAAANMESDVVWGIITTNAALNDGVNLFDNSGHSNDASSGAAPDVTTIGAGMTAMGQQTGLDSDDTTYLNLMGRYLVGGWATHTVRMQLTSANYQPTAQSGINVYNTLTPITEARLTGNGWYIFADPGQIDTVEYAYLDGQEGVYTETRVGFEVDGVEVKVRQDFAAKAIDYRGMYRNTGAGG